MMKIKAFYLGYDIKTMYLISSNKKFELIGVATIPELLELKTHNIFDSVYRTLYRWQIENRHLKLQNLYIFIVSVCRCFMSSFYAKYSEYLLYLIRNKICIINENEIPASWNIDVFIVNNWWKIAAPILAIPRYGCINIHPSALPKYRGAVPTLWSLKNGDVSSAVSFIVLNSKMDAGSIIAQYVFPIGKHDDSIDLEYKIEEITSKYLLRDIDSYVNGQIIPSNQIEEDASSTAKYRDYMQVNFEMESCIEIRNKVILYPYLCPIDLCYMILDKVKINIKNCSISSKKMKPGIKKRIGLNVFVGCRDGLSIKIRLFRDLSIKNSLYLIFS